MLNALINALASLNIQTLNNSFSFDGFYVYFQEVSDNEITLLEGSCNPEDEKEIATLEIVSVESTALEILEIFQTIKYSIENEPNA